MTVAPVVAIRSLERAHPRVFDVVVAVLLASVFVPMSLLRIVDGDEGTYLLVSRLVVEGQLPYHDFFYPQMYLLPYVYGLWMKLVGYSWYAARLLSAIFCVALGLLVYRQVAARASRAWGLLAAVMLAFSSLAFGWYPLIKTFVLPTLLLVAAYSVLGLRSRWRWAACGLFVGLAVTCRVYLIAVLPAFLLEIYLTEPDRRARLAQFGRFGIAFAATLLPIELFFLIDPETFVFNVAGNHLIRMDEGTSWWDQKTVALRMLLGLQGAEGAATFQFLLLALLSLAAWFSTALSRQRLPLASAMAICLLVASHVPTPVYNQYFCMVLPFLLVDAVVFLARLVAETQTARLRHVAAVFVVAYVAVSPLDFYRYTVTGDLIEGLTTPADWRISTIRAIGASIDRHLRPGRPYAISFWPGYFVETRAAILPGLENHFALYYSNKISSRQIAQFKLMSSGQLLSHLKEHNVDVIALANHTPNRTFVRDEIVRNGYIVSERIGTAEIFTLPRADATRRAM